MNIEVPLNKLTDIMKALRGPDGCPWDLEQNHETLKPYLIEECYECLEAIDQGDDHHLKEELGDVLLQVVFHSQLAMERNAFTFEDVEKAICEKMIRRHPHVFGNSKISSVQAVKTQWEEIKKQEKTQEKTNEQPKTLLENIPSGLPPIQKAIKVQKKAQKQGFEWPEIKGVLNKFKEELQELEEAIESKNSQEIEAELGDLFFILIKASRFLNCDAEKALNKTTTKFSHRFYHMEKTLNKNGKKIENTNIIELTQAWNNAKKLDNIPIT